MTKTKSTNFEVTQMKQEKNQPQRSIFRFCFTKHEGLASHKNDYDDISTIMIIHFIYVQITAIIHVRVPSPDTD